MAGIPQFRSIFAMVICLSILPILASAADIESAPVKKTSIFSPPALIEKAKANADKYPWAKDIQKRAVDAAQPWMKFSDDELWDLMFGATIDRSWMVWSNGFCPACKKNVPMYNWKINALEHPWKLQCPHCNEYFPKNDFHAFYKSGLDEHGVFDSQRADRSLLYNTEHPDATDPLHMFGVDDGTDYKEGENRWRFIGTYLIYGHWKQLLVNGTANLAAAYAVTGDPAYAHKAGVLLDRVADLYPTFDFKEQAEVYEIHQANGYVSTWHDACGETRSLVMAYDQVFDGIKNDKDLVKFLAKKAKRYKLDNPKSSFVEIQRNIEDRLLKDPLANRKKVESNYPQTDLTFAMIKTILAWPQSRNEVNNMLGNIIETGTKADGASGEKGLSCYSAWAVRTLAEMLEQYSRVEPGYLESAFKQHPNLYKSFQFFLDLWCLQQYYPNIGDSEPFSYSRTYNGVILSKNTGINPSMYTFLYNLYNLTSNPAYMQLIYLGNGNSVDNLPYDIYADDPAQIQKNVKQVVDREGLAIKIKSANKEQWHVAVMRSGKEANERATWMSYDGWGPHGHANCMNLGLYAKGLDLMPDFGYPPVQYGGWDSPKADWFKITASHNTVVIDGKSQPKMAGKTTLWADGKQIHAIRTTAPDSIAKQYERTIAMVDISDSDSYILDVFRVVGGTDHAKFMHSQISSITSEGLSLKPAEDYGHGTFMRNFRTDSSPKPGWSVDWAVDDVNKKGVPGPDVHLHYTDLTSGAQASLCESWVSLAINGNDEAWLPTVMLRRQSDKEPLVSTFVGVIEPYYQQSNISEIRRLPLVTESGEKYSDAYAAVEVKLKDGRRDVLITSDIENPLGASPKPGVFVQKDTGISFDGDTCLVRFAKDGSIEKIAVSKGQSISIGNTKLKLKNSPDFIEVRFINGKPTVETGDSKNIEISN